MNNDESNINESEFGRGCVYCLGLFLAHADKYAYLKKAYKNIKRTGYISAEFSFFYGATDHLHEIIIPNKFPVDIQTRIKNLDVKCHGWRFMNSESDAPTEKDVMWAIGEAKSILLAIDMFLGIDACEARWP